MKIKNICLLIILSCCSFVSLADNAAYQIDMIIWVHEPINATQELPMLTKDTRNAITLRASTDANNLLYQLLPRSNSKLQRQYYALSHKPDYHVIAHYSWLQPGNNQRTVIIPTIDNSEWSLEGSVRVIKSNYYLFNTELLLSKKHNPKTSFIVSQSVRLKPGVTYYLDHPSAGILIRVAA